MDDMDTANAQEPTRGAIIHLLRIRKGGPDSLFSKVLTCLEAVGSDEPTGRDITWLRQCGYIKWNHKVCGDVLTPIGLHIIEREAKKLARIYGLHHITHRPARRRSNHGPQVSCTCGWSDFASRSNGNRLAASAARHMGRVADGSYKAPRPIEEFLNEYFPPKFDFNSGSRLAPPSDAMPGNGAALTDGCTPQAAPNSLEARR